MKHSIDTHINLVHGKKWLAVISTAYLVLLITIKLLKPGHPTIVDPALSVPYDWNPVISWYDMQLHWHQYLANVAAFLPAGILATCFINRKTVYWLFGIGFCFIFEILQPIIGKGVFDISSVILSAVGYAIGYIIAVLYLYISNKNSMIS